MYTEFDEVKTSEVKVYPVKVRAYCPECGDELDFTGYSHVRQYTSHQHRCHKCEKLYSLRHRYPIIAHREIDQI